MKRHIILLLAVMLTCIYSLSPSNSYADENTSDQTVYKNILSVTVNEDNSILIEYFCTTVRCYEHDDVDISIDSDDKFKAGERNIHTSENLMISASIGNEVQKLLVRYPSLLRPGWNKIDGQDDSYSDHRWWEFADGNVYINEDAIITEDVPYGSRIKPGKYYLTVDEKTVIMGPVEFEIPASAADKPVKYKQEMSVSVRDDGSLGISFQYPGLFKYFESTVYGIEIYKLGYNDSNYLPAGSDMPDKSPSCVMKWTIDASDIKNESYALEYPSAKAYPDMLNRGELTQEENLKPGSYLMYLTDVYKNIAIAEPVEFVIPDDSDAEATSSPEPTAEPTAVPTAEPTAAPTPGSHATEKVTESPTASVYSETQHVTAGAESAAAGMKGNSIAVMICACTAVAVGIGIAGMILIKKKRHNKS